MVIPVENKNGIRIISVGKSDRVKRDVSETSRKIKTELQFCQQHAAVFYTVYEKMTEIDKMCVEQIRRNMDCISRRKMFLVMTDFTDIKDKENSRYTKSKMSVIRIISKLQDNDEAELQIKTIIRKIQIRESLMKRYSPVVVVPVSKSTRYLLIICMILLQEAKANNTTKPEMIQWKLMTKPVYFGGNTDLEYTIKTEDTSAPMAWVRIPNGEAVAYNKVPSDREKYGITVKYIETTMIYNLTIEQFDTTDLNRVYRCDFGFQSYGEKLLLNNSNFILKPTEKDVEYDFNLVDNILVGLVTIYNGYPKPLCRIQFEGLPIVNSLITKNMNSSIFYDTRISVKYNTNLCRGIVNVSCSYGDKKVNFDQYVDDCTAKPTEKDVEYDFNLVGNILVGLVTIYNGYPKPFCRIQFEGTHILNSLISNNKNSSIFFDTRISVKYNTNLCRDIVNVSCSYGDKKVNFDQYVDNCTDQMAMACDQNNFKIVLVGGTDHWKNKTTNAILGNKRLQNDDRVSCELSRINCSRSKSAYRLGTHITVLAVPVLRRNSSLQDREKDEHQLKVIMKKIQLATATVTNYSTFFLSIINYAKLLLMIMMMVIMLSHSAQGSNTDSNPVINWKLMTKPVYFGASINLECIIKTEKDDLPKSWIRIPNGETIASDKIPTDFGKYGIAIKYNTTEMIYRLTTKQFNSTDVNRVYRCDFGFLSYAEKLMLNDRDFISRPKENDMRYNFSLVKSTLFGTVKIENGYPEPLCFGIFEGNNLSESMRINSTNGSSVFFNTNIEVNYSTEICRGTVNVTCRYGDYEIHIIQLVDVCSVSSESNQIIVAVIIGTLLVVMIAIILLLKMKLKEGKESCFLWSGEIPTCDLSKSLQSKDGQLPGENSNDKLLVSYTTATTSS